MKNAINNIATFIDNNSKKSTPNDDCDGIIINFIDWMDEELVYNDKIPAFGEGSMTIGELEEAALHDREEEYLFYFDDGYEPDLDPYYALDYIEYIKTCDYKEWLKAGHSESEASMFLYKFYTNDDRCVETTANRERSIEIIRTNKDVHATIRPLGNSKWGLHLVDEAEENVVVPSETNDYSQIDDDDLPF